MVLALAAVACAKVVQTGQTVQVNDIDYFAAPTSVNIIDLTAQDVSFAIRGQNMDLVPLTVLGDSSNSFTREVLISLVNNYTAMDDVFNTGFLQSKCAQRNLTGISNFLQPSSSHTLDLDLPVPNPWEEL
jgi:hypothetical protein